MDLLVKRRPFGPGSLTKLIYLPVRGSEVFWQDGRAARKMNTPKLLLVLGSVGREIPGRKYCRVFCHEDMF